MSEALLMANKDIDRLRTIRDVLEGKFTQVEAARLLRLTDRQIRRLCVRVNQEGTRGILHRLCGQPSNRGHDPELLGQTLSALHHPLWDGFRPTFAMQKLKQYHGIVLGEWTVRRIMLLSGLWSIRRHKPKHRSWRPRRTCVGLLVQLDGSDHDWFEGRGPRCVLLIFIDDATSRILYGEFIPVENTAELFRTTRTYLEGHGRPAVFYVDKDSIYKVNRPATVDEELQDTEPLTQFTRAMRQLDIEVLAANSPQAKGRVERGFGTHQDRLVKELRLRGICDIGSANRYLWDEYIPEHNASYAVEPSERIDAHRPLLPAHDLDAILCPHFERSTQNDFTVRHRNRFYQLVRDQGVRLRPKTSVTVQHRLDGSIHIVCKDRELLFKEVPGRPYRPAYAGRRRTQVLVATQGRTQRRADPFYAAFSLAPNEPTNPPASALLR